MRQHNVLGVAVAEGIAEIRDVLPSALARVPRAPEGLAVDNLPPGEVEDLHIGLAQRQGLRVDEVVRDVGDVRQVEGDVVRGGEEFFEVLGALHAIPRQHHG